jgi:hypothetical protein
MRRSVLFSFVLIAGLVLAGCSDSPTEVSPSELKPVPSEASIAAGCVPAPTAASLLTMINGLLPRSPLRTSLIALVGSLPPRFQDRIKTAVRRLIFPIQDLVLKSFYAGRLTGGTSVATYNKVLRFIEALYCYVGLTPPVFPGTTGGEDIVVAVLFSNSPTTTVVVPSKHAAVTVPTGAVPTGGVTIVVRKLDDGPPGPLLTTLDQYPFFYEFTGTTATGPVTFNLDVLAGICPRDDLGEIDNDLRLAHNVGLNFGDVEVLPRPAGAVPGLDCANLPPPLTSAGTSSGLFAWGGWSRALTPLGRALLPEPLHAATLALATLGVGGTTKKFSPFGIVDITSNPANLDFSPGAGTFGSLTALPGGTATAPSVLLRSQQGHPIPNWPVTFTVTAGGGTINGGVGPITVTTGLNGVASLTSWNLGVAGVNTVSATPTPVSQLPSEPLSTDAFRPAGEFAPSLLTFTATGAGDIDYEDAGWRYLVSSPSPSREFPVPVTDFDEPSYLDIGWLTGGAGFGHDGGNECSLNLSAQDTEWPAETDILLRKPFVVPPGTTSVMVRVAIDNDIKVFVNGADVTGTGTGVEDENGFMTHEGCPTRGSFVFTADVTGEGINWLAIQARDRGGSSYVDAEVVPVIPDL